MNKLSVAPISTGAYAMYPYSAGLEASLKFVSNFGDEVSMTRRHGDRLWVPRGLAPSTGVDLRISRPVPAVNCKCPPRDSDQARVVEESLALMKAGIDHGVEAPTGFGKTYVGTAVPAMLGQRTLIVCPKQDLMDEWKRTLIQLIGIDPKEIGIAQADKLDYKGKRFVLGMVQSLAIPGKYDNEFWEYFGCLVLDEGHKMAADFFQNICFFSPARHRMFLSATPKRSDGKTPILGAHVGPIMVTGTLVPMKPKILLQNTGWKVPSWMTQVDPGKMMGVYKSMANNAQRNAMLVKFALEAVSVGRTVVMMADMTVHLDNLFQMLAPHIGGENIGKYVGEISKNKELLKLNAHKKIVLATYGMCAEGTNYPHWDTLVFCTPRANVKQPLGRILRSKPGKKTPVALDPVDTGSIFSAFRNKRLKQYYEVGAEVKHL